MIACNMMWLTTLMAFVPLFLPKMTHHSEGTDSILLAILGFMMFIGQMDGPALLDRIGRKPVLILFSLIAIVLPLVIIAFYHSLFLLIIGMAVFAFSNAYQPVLIAIIPGESVPRMFAASAIVAIVLVGEALGSKLGPIIGGILADQVSLFAPFFCNGCCRCVCLYLFVWNEGNRTH